MLNRITTTVPTIIPRIGLPSWRAALRTGPTSGLLRFVGLLIAVCALANLYLWQASLVSSMQDEVAAAQAAITRLERENVSLMLQVAQWNSPGHIKDVAQQQGLRAGQAPVRLQVQPLLDSTQDRQGVTSVNVWQWLTGWLPQDSIKLAQRR